MSEIVDLRKVRIAKAKARHNAEQAAHAPDPTALATEDAQIPVFAPAGISAEGFVTQEGQGVVYLRLMQGQTAAEASCFAMIAITSELAFELSKILAEVGARTELQAGNYRKQNARRLENDRKAGGKIILPGL